MKSWFLSLNLEISPFYSGANSCNWKCAWGYGDVVWILMIIHDSLEELQKAKWRILHFLYLWGKSPHSFALRSNPVFRHSSLKWVESHSRQVQVESPVLVFWSAALLFMFKLNLLSIWMNAPPSEALTLTQLPDGALIILSLQARCSLIVCPHSLSSSASSET